MGVLPLVVDVMLSEASATGRSFVLPSNLNILKVHVAIFWVEVLSPNSLIENFGLWCRWYCFYFRLMFMSICFVRFVFLGWFCCFWGVYFIINDLVYFIDWNIVTLNGRSIVMTFLFDWISSLFMGFLFIISSLVILYSDDYMFGDLNIVCMSICVCRGGTTPLVEGVRFKEPHIY